jgi:hypothetical protein
MGISITTIPVDVDLASDEIGMAFVNMHRFICSSLHVCVNMPHFSPP